jgi:hypothetical protein
VELDVRPADVAGVKTVGDIVHLEYYEPCSGAAKELVVKRQDFDGMFKKGDPTEVLSNAALRHEAWWGVPPTVR